MAEAWSLKEMTEILRCTKCGSYTLRKECKCGSECLSPKPPKWSPTDKYSRYRLEYKKNERQ